MLRFVAIAFSLCVVLTAGLGLAGEPGPRDEDAPEEFTVTESGLKYRILRKGAGKPPTADAEVTVHYKGWLDDGAEFDSSYERRKPATFPLDRVIAGWTRGLQFVQPGGMIELEIPSELGYGDRGVPPRIPPAATLHFLIELLDIQEPLKPGEPDPDAPTEFTTAASGIKYRVLRRGNGHTPNRDDTVKVHSRVWLDNGQEFDSSYKAGKPVTIRWSRVVETWTDVMQHVSEGGMIELEVPSDLAYGAEGLPGKVPPNATMHVLVEIIGIE